MKYFWMTIFATVLLVACDQLKPSESKKKSDPNVSKSYYDDGTVKAEVRFDSKKKRHGISKSYYPDGQLRTEIKYDHGQKVSSVQYYENGNKHMEFFYKNGLKDSLRTKYWKNGKIQSTLEYSQDRPSTELKEFNKSGKQLSKYANLVVKQIDRLDTHGEYILELYFDKRVRKAQFFQGDLVEGKYFPDFLPEMEKNNGKARIVITPIPGTFLMKKVNFIGRYKTLYGNPYITQKSVNLAIEY